MPDPDAFEKGQRVLITDEMFQGYDAVVDRVLSDGVTIRLSVTIFGREAPIEVEIRQVRRID
jgi:transcription antitermination factor NusG